FHGRARRSSPLGFVLFRHALSACIGYLAGAFGRGGTGYATIGMGSSLSRSAACGRLRIGVGAAPRAPGRSLPQSLIGGMPALNNTSQCMCTWAGVITIVNPGQMTTEIP